MRKNVFLLMLLASSIPTICQASSWGSPVTIAGYYVYATGSAYIKTSVNQNPDGCASTNYLYIDTSVPFFKELYATIVAARATGETVSLLYDGCVGSYPKISSVAVPNIW